MNQFKLKSKFQPAGDQPRAIEGLIKSLQTGRKYQTLLGVTGSGKTFTMANVVQKLQRPALVISHNKTLAAQLAAEFQEFFPNNAVHYFVSYYDYYQPEAYIPRTDTYIEKETQINEEIDRLRNAATQSLLSRRDVIICASVSCIYGLGNPADYLDLSMEIKRGETVKRDKLLRRLTDLQYHRNDLDLQRGTYRAQGDVVELILSSEDTVIRLDFFGDQVEKIERLDALTNEKLEDLEKFTIFPAKHFVTPEEKLQTAMESIRQELVQRLKELKSQGKLLEAQRLEQRTNFDLEMLANTGFVAGIENYSRHLDGRAPGEPPSTLIDYFPDDFLLFLDESHQSVPQIGAMYEGDKSRKTTLVDYGFRLPSALDNRPLKFAEFEKKITQAVFVSATPAKFEIESSLAQKANFRPKRLLKNVGASFSRPSDDSGRLKAAPTKPLNPPSIIEQIIRPTGLLDPTIEIKPIKNQVDDLIEQINGRIKNHERILAATLTKRMAEELSEYLNEEGIKVHYVHSDVDTFERLETLRDLRLGVYDVLVGINLLREGLDLPEVSLVAILDADKEGFLRSETFFMQMMGRAARHVRGHVIMYADKKTGSMDRAINETNRRRKLQEAYNKQHGITPQTIKKAIADTRLAGAKGMEADAVRSSGSIDPLKMDAQELKLYLEELGEQMDLAAKNLEFELAAKLRDRLNEVKKIRKLRKK
ncbi:MAG: excinuclease ABC subunit UvrB [Patescibacteria group bacterium]|nr:excinuclease ABC subunit UvrB [Patescibacteria group bacterium]